jgi:hypothetical protein
MCERERKSQFPLASLLSFVSDDLISGKEMSPNPNYILKLPLQISHSLEHHRTHTTAAANHNALITVKRERGKK